MIDNSNFMGGTIPGNSFVDPQATNPRAGKRDKFGHVINLAKRSAHKDEGTVFESRSYWVVTGLSRSLSDSESVSTLSSRDRKKG